MVTDKPLHRAVAAVLILGQFVIMANNVMAATTGGISNGSGIKYETIDVSSSEKIKQQAHSDGYNWLYRSQEDMNNTSVNGESITFGNKNVKQALDDTGGQLTTSDLSVATSQPQNASQYYASGSAPKLSDLQALSQADEETIGNLSDSSMSSWEADANSESTATVQGHAYATINSIATKGSSAVDSDDPMFNKMLSVQSSVNSGDIFSDCSLDKALLTTTETVHTVKETKCSDYAVDGCTLNHQVELAILKYGNSTVNYLECADGRDNCVAYVIGTYSGPSAVMNAGTCGAYEVSQTFAVVNSEAVTKATITNVVYAGAIYAYQPATSTISSDTRLFGYNSNNGYADSLTDGFTCNYNSGKLVHSANVDLTKTVQDSGGFTIHTVTLGDSKGYALLEIDYDPLKVIRDDDWGDDACEASAIAINQGVVSGTVECTNYFATVNGKIDISGVTIDPSYITSTAGISPACSQAAVKVDKDNFADSSIVNCSTLANTEGCGYMSTTCKIWAEDNSTCLLTESVYDCGYNDDYEITRSATAYSCPGGFQCQGIDCMNILIGDATQDFSKAMGLMQQSQAAANDISCTTTVDLNSVDASSASGSVECSFFAGKTEECNDWDILGMGNQCCSEPGSDADWASYTRQIMHTFKVDNIEKLIKTGNIVDYSPVNSEAGIEMMYGMGWDMIKNYTATGKAYTKVMDKIRSPLVNTLNNIIPYAGEVYKGVTFYAEDMIIKSLAEIVIKYLYNGVASIANEVFGTSISLISSVSEAIKDVQKKVTEWATQKLAQMIGQEAATAVVSFVGSAVTIIGWVYAAYQVTKILATLLTKCDDEEIELQTKRRLNQCDKVGRWCSKKIPLIGTCIRHTESYCCFTSPLSRILNKQIRYYLNGCSNYLYPGDDPSCAFGDAESPNCGGLTIAQIQATDWNRIDLTEWLTLLQTSGALTTSGLAASATEYLPIGGYDSNGNYHDYDSQVYSSE